MKFIKNLKKLLKHESLEDGETTVVQQDNVFDTMYGDGWVAQVVKIDNDWVYNIVYIDNEDYNLWTLIKTHPDKKSEHTIICWGNDTVH